MQQWNSILTQRRAETARPRPLFEQEGGQSSAMSESARAQGNPLTEMASQRTKFYALTVQYQIRQPDEVATAVQMDMVNLRHELRDPQEHVSFMRAKVEAFQTWLIRCIEHKRCTDDLVVQVSARTHVIASLPTG